MADKHISQLVPTESPELSDFFLDTQEDSSSSTGYSSRKVTLSNIAQALLNRFEYQTGLDTTSKKIFGAINEQLYRSGDVVKLPQQRAVFIGYLTHSNDRLYFSIPMGKTKAEGVDVSISGNILVRSIVGYPNDTSTEGTIDSSTVTNISMNGGLLCLGFQLSSALFPTSGTNALKTNTPVAISPTGGDLTITFT